MERLSKLSFVSSAFYCNYLLAEKPIQRSAAIAKCHEPMHTGMHVCTHTHGTYRLLQINVLGITGLSATVLSYRGVYGLSDDTDRICFTCVSAVTCSVPLRRLDEEEVRSEINQHAQGEKVRETTRRNRHQIHSKEQSVLTKTGKNFPNRARER